MCLNKSNKPYNTQINYNGNNMEHENCYSCLGIDVSSIGSFKPAETSMADNARKGTLN